MNANELADELEKASTRAEDHGTISKRNRLASIMLRNQQAEIEALKKQLAIILEANIRSRP